MTSARAWVADPGITWRILLTARLVEPPPAAALRQRARALARDQGWAEPVVVVDESVEATRVQLGAMDGDALGVGLCGAHVVVAAHHSLVDGLGLLTVLGRLLDTPVVSGARGVADRPDEAGAIGTVARRLREVVLSPPAGVWPGRQPSATGSSGSTTDSYAQTEVAGRWGTADVVHAGCAAVLERPTPRRRRARHVAVAVGVSRDDESRGRVIADRSALVRLRDVEGLSVAEIAGLLRTAPTQRPVGAGGVSGPGARAASLAMRLLARRLGSTLLVSHLGVVDAPGVHDLVFHPVTAGGSGLSLGAVSRSTPSGTTTTLTLRGRSHRWMNNGLEQVLEAVAGRLVAASDGSQL